MIKNIRKHFWHYLVYFIIFCGGLLLLLATRGEANLQALFIIMIGLLYFMWAMVHHYLHHELHSRIVIEYILVVILGVVLALFLFGA
jgi:hypothetical protein